MPIRFAILQYIMVNLSLSAASLRKHARLSRTRIKAWLRTAAAIGLIVGSVHHASAAEITVTQDPLNDFSRKILIRSEIKKGDFDAFTKATDSALSACNRLCGSSPNCKDLCRSKVSIWVDLDSSGGDVMEALRIGRLIHQDFMYTRVLPGRQCASACVFILQAGVIRVPALGSHVAVHRPKFDAAYFADLTPDQARTTYNNMVGELRKYFISEMNGSDEAFRLMVTTPSDQVRVLTFAELRDLGLNGEDASYEEYSEALNIKKYGTVRWPLIKDCVGPSGDLAGCEKKAYELFPKDK